MPRTRDLILFLVCALFLFGLILFTISRSNDAIFSVNFSDEVLAPTEVVIASNSNEIDRPGAIARLREKIGDMLVLEDAHPSVVGESEPVATTTEEEVAGAKQVVLMRCAGATDGLSIAANWPRENVALEYLGNARVATYVDAASGAPRTLITLPAYAIPNGSPNCLDSEIVGLTLDGSLIFNTDAISYDATGANTLIGYARDGIAVYGQYEGETDACGGYDPGTGYRYSVSRERNFILGCFSAAPAAFTI